jgi:hypothetical protein
MEIPPRFDLSESIQQWRIALQGAPALGPEEMDELESHLHDSIEALCARGFSDEESFLLASGRLGSSLELKREFGKVNRGRVWMGRAFWMLGGVFVWSVITVLSLIGARLLTSISAIWLGNAHAIRFLDIAGWWMVAAGATFVLWRLVTRRNEQMTRAVRFCLRRPFIPALGLIGFSLSAPHLYTWTLNLSVNTLLFHLSETVSERWLANMQSLSMDHPTASVWTNWGWSVNWSVWTGALIFLVRHHWQTIRPGTVKTVSASIRLDELSSGERQKVQARLARGLSLKESIFLAKPRHDETSNPITRTTNSRQLWGERILWMLSGVVLHRILVELTVLLETGLIEFGRGWALNPHGAGFLLVCAQWGAVAVLLAGLWIFVNRFTKESLRGAQFVCERPFLTVTCLFLFFAGWGWLMGSVIEWRPQVRVVDPAILDWSNYGHQMLFSVMGVILFFWLGKKAVKPPVKHNYSTLPS